MKIKAEEVKHIAGLAKLKLSEDEIKLYQKQMTDILKYVNKMKKLKLPDDAQQMAHASGSFNVFRADQAEECDAGTRKQIVEAFPKSEGELLESRHVFEDRSEDL